MHVPAAEIWNRKVIEKQCESFFLEKRKDKLKWTGLNCLCSFLPLEVVFFQIYPSKVPLRWSLESARWQFCYVVLNQGTK